MWLLLLVLGCAPDPHQVFDDLLAQATRAVADGKPLEGRTHLLEAARQASERGDAEDEATALLAVGLLEGELGRDDDALAHLTEATARAALLPDGLLEGRSLLAYVDLQVKRGDATGVEATLVRACDRLDKGSVVTASQGCHERLGRHYLAAGRYSEAYAQLERVAAALHGDLSVETERVVMVELDVARAMRELGDLEGSAVHVSRAADAVDLLAPDHGLRASVLAHRSELHRRSGRLPEAVADLETAVALARSRFGQDDVATALVWFNLGATRLESLDFPGARAAFEEAKRIRAIKLPAGDPELVACDEGVAMADAGWKAQHDLDGVTEAVEAPR